MTVTDPVAELLKLFAEIQGRAAETSAAMATLIPVVLKQSATEVGKREIERPRDPGERVLEWNERLGVGISHPPGLVRDARDIPPVRQTDASDGLTAAARLRFNTPFEDAVITPGFNPYDPGMPPVQLPGS